MRRNQSSTISGTCENPNSFTWPTKFASFSLSSSYVCFSNPFKNQHKSLTLTSVAGATLFGICSHFVLWFDSHDKHSNEPPGLRGVPTVSTHSISYLHIENEEIDNKPWGDKMLLWNQEGWERPYPGLVAFGSTPGRGWTARCRRRSVASRPIPSQCRGRGLRRNRGTGAGEPAHTTSQGTSVVSGFPPSPFPPKGLCPSALSPHPGTPWPKRAIGSQCSRSAAPCVWSSRLREDRALTPWAAPWSTPAISCTKSIECTKLARLQKSDS